MMDSRHNDVLAKHIVRLMNAGNRLADALEFAAPEAAKAAAVRGWEEALAAAARAVQ